MDLARDFQRRRRGAVVSLPPPVRGFVRRQFDVRRMGRLRFEDFTLSVFLV